MVRVTVLTLEFVSRRLFSLLLSLSFQIRLALALISILLDEISYPLVLVGHDDVMHSCLILEEHLQLFDQLLLNDTV